MKNNLIVPTSEVTIEEAALEDLFKEMSDWSDKIAKRAYEFFAASGFTNGHDTEDWFKAEQELLKPLMFEIENLKDEIVVKAEVPGFEAKDLNVRLTGQRLVIEGEREIGGEKKEKDTTVNTKKSQQICRAIDLPAAVNAEEARSELKNGILELKLPKAEKPKQIKIVAA
jgi:HSP20 family protein